jgi:catechol 2,3-dioxygenase-like lactoylglutathione lyase family enzyme
MPNFKGVHATLPASDFERAKAWYASHLGLSPDEEGVQGAYYTVGASRLLLYPSTYAGTNGATAASFEVANMEAAVAELRASGVVFEEYDIPGIPMSGGIATVENDGRTMKSAWFKDSEGNILALVADQA